MAGSRNRAVLVGLLLVVACVPAAVIVAPTAAFPAASPAALSAATPAFSEPSDPPAAPAPLPAATNLRPAATNLRPAVRPPSAAVPPAVVTPPPPAWDIEVARFESNARVEYFVERFSGALKPTFEVALRRGSRFAPMIHARLRAAGLPEDLIYLSLIESWFDPNAYSRAAAVGMWQFMTSTARGVGLRVDWWIDERRDPVRATDGAVAYLTELRDDFGSIYLAAAAYNGGSGRISRGLATHATALEGRLGDDLFFALADQQALRTETRDYVPKLIAAALVGKDPLRYNLHVTAAEPFRWDSVTVPLATPLLAVAKGLAISIDSLLEYNPQILRGMTPPIGSAVWLRVPVGTTAGFLERFTALPEAERTGVRPVVTRAGDYVTKIARANGLTAAQLNTYNPQATRLKNGNLQVGQRILVPRLDVVRGARAVPDPKIERYGSSGSYHAVKRGESLLLIARRNGTSVAVLKRLNSLRSDRIRIGQRLRIR